MLFLLETGLLSFKNHYQELGSGHYFIDAIVLSLAFTNGVRITNGYSVVGLFQNCFASRQVVYFLATDPNQKSYNGHSNNIVRNKLNSLRIIFSSETN